MRPTPAKAATRRSPSRSQIRGSSSSPRLRNRRSTSASEKNIHDIKRRLEESLGSDPSHAGTPVAKIMSKNSKRCRSPDMNIGDNSSETRPKKIYGRRAKMSPRTHGAAIAKSLASPAIDSAFLMSTTAPITPSKRSSAESALHYVARNSKRGIDDHNNNINTSSKKKRKKKAFVSAGRTDDSQSQRSEEEKEEEGKQVVFVPKGKLEERWLKNFNKWKKSVEHNGPHDADHSSPLPTSWINTQRKEYKAMKRSDKKTSMTQSKVDMLESSGFSWDAPKKESSNSTSDQTDVYAASNSVDSKAFITTRRRKNDGNDDNSNEESSPSKRKSPRKSCPTQFYHNLSEKKEEGGGNNRGNNDDGKMVVNKKGMGRNEPKTYDQAIKEGYKCSKCGQPKKGHTCTMNQPTKAVENVKIPVTGYYPSASLSSPSDVKDQPTKLKREGKKKRRSRGGRQGVSSLTSLGILEASGASSNKNDESTKVNRTKESVVNETVSSKKANAASGGATKKNNETASRGMDVEMSAAPTDMKFKMQTADHDDDDPKSPFPSSSLRTSNLECPESGSISVGQAEHSPAKKNVEVPEQICIRELMMACLTEEDKEMEKHRSQRTGLELKPTEQEVDDEDTMKDDSPPPNTPVPNKATLLSAFSPLSMTSPLRANNLLETSYHDEQTKDQDIALRRQNRQDSPPKQPAERRLVGSSLRSNRLVQSPPRNVNTDIVETATQTTDRVEDAKQLQLIQAERQYREKMAEYGKLEFEAKMVTERMRQIEERIRQIESTSISNDLREYDEMRRRTSYPYPAKKLRPSLSQRHYRSSDDEYSDEYDSRRHRNRRHHTHSSHADRESSIKRRKFRSNSRRSQSPSRRSNSQRHAFEDSTTEHECLSGARIQRKKGSKKKKNDEEGWHSISQSKKLKSPYAELQTDEARLRRQTRQSDALSDVEEDALDAREQNDTNKFPESAKMPKTSNEERKKESDSSSTKQSSEVHVQGSNNAELDDENHNEDKPKDPLYWLAVGGSDSDEESWDFDGPMILPPPPV